MIPRTIAQAVAGEGSLRTSADFDERWRPEVERIVDAYGLPGGTSAPDTLFVLPFMKRHVAVVSLLGKRFRFLILAKKLYDVIPDPFAIVERFPPTWESGEDLRELVWPEEHLPKRTIALLDEIFKNGDGPLLLGASQTLVDSGRMVLIRDQPDPKVVRDLWALLPDSTRRQTRFATFAYSLQADFNLIVLPSLPEGGLPPGYLSEDQSRDYPESRYERELQTAVESGDQRTVDRLFARRTSAETLKLGFWVVLGMAALSIATRLLMAR